MKMGGTLTETVHPGNSTRPFVLVMGPDVFSSYDLPDHGALVIGRDPNAQIWIDDPMLSGHHAQLTIEAEGSYFVEDLASRNGTSIRQQRLEPRTRQRLEIGETVAVGSCLVVIQAGRAADRTRRAASYGFLRMRLDEEVARAEMGPQRRFCLARLRVDPQASSERIREAAAQVLRPFDTFAAFAPNEFAVLFTSTPDDQARSLVSELTMMLQASGIAVRTAVAFYPDHGRSAPALEAATLRLLQPTQATIDLGDQVVAVAPVTKRLYQQAERVAASRIAVLITGETGSGKDVLARFIHARSKRKGLFQAVNCAALPESLLESHLFGHLKGAFTGADRDRTGLVEEARDGTLFLDEIAEVPMAIQAKLLRLLENHEIQPLGARQPKTVDVRFIAATNENLVRAVTAKRFRQDLLFRLKAFDLFVPPLRERREEILPLAHALLARLARDEKLDAPPVLAPGVEAWLLEHRWPGNVRELANLLHRALVLSDRKVITEDELPANPDGLPEGGWDAEAPGAGVLGAGARGDDAEPGGDQVKPSSRVANPSKGELRRAIARCGGNQSRTAELLGIPRKRLRELLEFYDLPLPRG